MDSFDFTFSEHNNHFLVKNEIDPNQILFDPNQYQYQMNMDYPFYNQSDQYMHINSIY